MVQTFPKVFSTSSCFAHCYNIMHSVLRVKIIIVQIVVYELIRFTSGSGLPSRSTVRSYSTTEQQLLDTASNMYVRITCTAHTKLEMF